MNLMFSRTGHTNPGGKLCARIDVPVTEETNDAVIAMATLAGVSRAEWVRELVERTVFGELAMTRRIARRGASMESDDRRTEGAME